MKNSDVGLFKKNYLHNYEDLWTPRKSGPKGDGSASHNPSLMRDKDWQGQPLESCFLIHKIKVEQIPYCRVVLKKK